MRKFSVPLHRGVGKGPKAIESKSNGHIIIMENLKSEEMGRHGKSAGCRAGRGTCENGNVNVNVNGNGSMGEVVIKVEKRRGRPAGPEAGMPDDPTEASVMRRRLVEPTSADMVPAPEGLGLRRLVEFPGGALVGVPLYVTLELVTGVGLRYVLGVRPDGMDGPVELWDGPDGKVLIHDGVDAGSPSHGLCERMIPLLPAFREASCDPCWDGGAETSGSRAEPLCRWHSAPDGMGAIRTAAEAIVWTDCEGAHIEVCAEDGKVGYAKRADCLEAMLQSAVARAENAESGLKIAKARLRVAEERLDSLDGGMMRRMPGDSR